MMFIALGSLASNWTNDTKEMAKERTHFLKCMATHLVSICLKMSIVFNIGSLACITVLIHQFCSISQFDNPSNGADFFVFGQMHGPPAKLLLKGAPISIASSLVQSSISLKMHIATTPDCHSSIINPPCCYGHGSSDQSGTLADY